MRNDEYATDDAMAEAHAARHGDARDEEYDAMVTFANAMGFYVNRHKQFDRNRTRANGEPPGEFYLQRSKKFGGRLEHEPSILRFAHPQEIYDWLNEYRKQNGGA